MNLCTGDWVRWDAPQFKGVQRPTQRGQSLYAPLRIKAGEAPSLGVEKRLLGRRRVRGFSGSRTTMPTAFRVLGMSHNHEGLIWMNRHPDGEASRAGGHSRRQCRRARRDRIGRPGEALDRRPEAETGPISQEPARKANRTRLTPYSTIGYNGGGGNRTPVPRRHSGRFYVHSRSFVSRVGGRRSTGFRVPQPDCVLSACRQAAHANQPAGVVGRISRRHPRDGLRVFTQPWHKNGCHIVFRQVFYEAS